MPAVIFDQVTKEFAGGAVRAVDRVSFEVHEGELLVLLGPSGCGKTTSLRMIAGLEEPDEGEVTIDGTLVSSPTRNVFVPTERRGIGMVFQSYAIWPHMTVFENVAFPLRARRARRAAIADKVEGALALVGLEGFAQRSATQLSGGQQQRVALARALVFEPRLLLLDEPLSNLDAKLRVRMRTELKELQRRTGITSVFVTHDQAESMALADRVVVMRQGHVEQIGTPEEIYEAPATRFVSEFVGSINFLPAEVSRELAPDGIVSLRFGDGSRAISCEWRGAAAPAVGQQMLVSVRPENLTLRPGPSPDHENVWDCVVRSAVYYGDHREYEVAVDDRIFKVSAPARTAVEPGERAYLACRAADVFVVRE